jgi:hypothetical protein
VLSAALILALARSNRKRTSVQPAVPS